MRNWKALHRTFPIYQERKRVCDLGYLREPYAAADGSIAYRCAAEPVANYVAKGGKIEDTVGRKCLCNALMANVGHARRARDGVVEPALVTVGDDLNTIASFLQPGKTLRRSRRGRIAAERAAGRVGSRFRPAGDRLTLIARTGACWHLGPPTRKTFGTRSAGAGRGGNAACGSVWYQYAVE